VAIGIAQVKIVPVSGDLDANHRRLMQVLQEIAEHEPDVIITPEGYLDGYIARDEQVTRENIARFAIDPARSPYVRAVSRWAADQKCWFVLGCARVVPGGVYNSALILDRSGEMVGIYDKTHLQSHDKKYLPGQDLPVFASDFGPFGVMICADRRWPETVRTLALKGARIILNPTYGNHSERNQCMMRTRSFESEVFIAFTHPVQSLVTGPKGEIILNERAEEATFAVSEVNLARVDERRARENSHLKHRRTDLYTL
jgi:predicted amidohydrolase